MDALAQNMSFNALICYTLALISLILHSIKTILEFEYTVNKTKVSEFFSRIIDSLTLLDFESKATKIYFPIKHVSKGIRNKNKTTFKDFEDFEDNYH